MHHLPISALLLLAATAYAAYDEEVCVPFKESYGLIPPPLPRNFEMRGEHIDHVGKTAHYQEILLDFSENRGKYTILLGGVEKHLLFDYDTRQVVEWDKIHPGAQIKDDPLSHDCIAKELEDSEHKDLFGFLDENSDSPKMYDTARMLRFGGKYAYAFNGTDRMPQRGLLGDLFVGCVYDQELDATYKVNYTFTNEQVYPSAGTAQEKLTGIPGEPLSVPIKGVFVGTVADADSGGKTQFKRSDHTFWFSGEPDFKLDAFRIPPYMYCEHYRGRKDMDPFPSAFTTRVQKTVIMRDSLGALATEMVTSYEDIMYHQERELARRDFTPDRDLDTEIFSAFNSPEPVSMVYDFNVGVVYVTHKSTGVCYARPIIAGDYFEASAESDFVQIAGPGEVFQMQHDEMEFKGTDSTRDIECDVYAGKYFSKRFNVTFHKETYVSTNGWHEEADQYLEFNVPVKHTIVTGDLNADLVEGVTSYHFFKFIAGTPPLTDFDVDGCIEDVKRTDFALLLSINAEEKKTIFTYKEQFLEAAQYYLTDVTDVITPLRIQRVDLRQVSMTDARTCIVFTLVDKARLRTKVPTGQPGPSLQDATNTLVDFIAGNSFAIKFKPPKDIKPTVIKALEGSLYVRLADGQLEAPPARNTEPWVEFADDTAEGTAETPTDEGMSTTGLTLLALAMLFIGCGIGVAVMYLYQRKYNQSNLEDRITLTPQASVEEGGAANTVANYSA